MGKDGIKEREGRGRRERREGGEIREGEIWGGARRMGVRRMEGVEKDGGE